MVFREFLFPQRFMLCLATLCLAAPGLSLVAGDRPERALPAALEEGSVESAWVENRGQWREGVDFVFRSGSVRAWLGEGALWIERRALIGAREDTVRAHAVRLTIEAGSLEGAVGLKRASGERSYLLGDDRSRWTEGVPAWHQVSRADVLPGVDFVLRPESSSFAYDLHVAPNVDERELVLRVEGARALRLDRAGGLVVETPLGELRQRPPVVWEVTARGARRPVPAKFVCIGDDRFGFSVERSDRGRALVIDPGFEWGTYLGGTDLDRVYDVSVLSSGVVGVCGISYSLDFPTVPGSYSTALTGLSDAFVFVFSPDGRHMVQSTYLGGTDDDDATSLAHLNGAGFVVAGSTLSLDFPIPSSAYQPQHAGGSDGFLLRLDPLMQSITAGSFLGTGGNDRVRGLSVSPQGYDVCGSTSSAGFPTTAGAWQTSFGGGNGVTGDGFLTRFNESLDQLHWSTYVGGTQNDVAISLETDDAGQVLLCGSTSSSNFHVTSGAFDTTQNGGTDAFVALVSATGQHALFSTFLGGASTDLAESVCFGPQGDVFVGGSTESSGFPVTPGGHDTAYGGLGDGFVARVSADGSALSWSTFLGDDESDVVNAVAFNDTVGVVAVGSTRSIHYPVTDYAYDKTYNGVQGLGFFDAVLSSFQADGALEYSTFFGGHQDDEALCLALDGEDCLVAGWTNSNNMPVTGSVFDPSYDYSGIPDGFCIRLSLDRYPFFYGTGKMTSAGNFPELYPSGFPSASYGPYQIWLDTYLSGSEVGYLIYSGSARDVPFAGASLLVGLPIYRGPILDFDVFGGAGVSIDITPAMIGQTWFFQGWFTDSGDPLGIGLTCGLEVTWYP